MSYMHIHVAVKSEKLLSFEEPPKTFSDLYDRKTLEDKIYDTKTIWGSELVKFAVNQTNDALDLEEILADTNFLLICPKENENEPFENVVVNEDGNIIFYCLRTKHWTGCCCRACGCSPTRFGYRLLNSSYREILTTSGEQCCYSSGSMKVACGINYLGSIKQRFVTNSRRCEYTISNPDGSVCLKLLKRDKKGYYDIHNSEDIKVGEVRKKLPYCPIEDIDILYGLSFVKDIPIHEKHLLLGCSYLLYYQKYGAWTNKRRCGCSILIKVFIILILLGIGAGVVLVYAPF